VATYLSLGTVPVYILIGLGLFAIVAPGVIVFDGGFCREESVNPRDASARMEPKLVKPDSSKATEYKAEQSTLPSPPSQSNPVAIDKNVNEMCITKFLRYQCKISR